MRADGLVRCARIGQSALVAIASDAAAEGRDQAERLHRDRYHVAEQPYVSEVDPKVKADAIIDNTDFANPVVIRW